jgi:outer membrane lipopolysaccharide assembly protein LptE/RlpB
MFRLARFWLLSVLIFFSGCGFHLKGAGQVGQLSFSELNVVFSQNVDYTFKSLLIQKLTLRGVKIIEVAQKEATTDTLIVSRPQINVKRTGVSALGDTTAESLRWLQTFTLVHQDKPLLEAEVVQYRDRQINPLAILAAEEERQSLYKSMAQQIADQIIIRISSYYESAGVDR